MTGRWQTVRELFERADALEGAERARLLDEIGAGDPGLRTEIEDLLEASRASEGFLEPPRLAAKDAAVQPAVGRVGSYEIVRVLATGGMGVVYEARQQNPNRSVAVKMMRLGFESASAERRFREEAGILARLRHPNIAHVHEAGVHVEDGGIERPWFAMEFVEDAIGIVEYAERFGLPRDARLELFCQVCDAIHHGHQRGVIHRDVKPENVLVDGHGHVKVIDFGVARIVDAGLWGDASPARQSLEIVGTIHAMSPEQLSGRGDAVDTRTDVYGLGVLLYELLTGELPFEVGGSPILEAARIVQEEPPRRPSSCSVAVTGDLEAIVLKAIAKVPDRRYASAAALADDIRRFRRREAVEARAPTLTYQVATFARRHRVLVGSTALVLVIVIVAAAISVNAAVRASRAESATKAQLERSTALFEQLLGLSTTLVSDFADRLGERFGSLELKRDMTLKGTEILEALEREAAGGDRRVRTALARSYLELGGVAGSDQHRSLGDTETAKRSFERAHEIATSLASESPNDPETLLLLADTTLRLGGLDERAGDEQHARTRYVESIELRERADAARQLPATERFGIATAHTRIFLICLRHGDTDGAMAELQRAGEVIEDCEEQEPGERRWRIERALHETRMASAVGEAGDTERAAALFAAAMERHRRLTQEEPESDELRLLAASAGIGYAETLRRNQRFDDAEREISTVVDELDAMIAAEPEGTTQQRQRVGALLVRADTRRDRARQTGATSSDRIPRFESARDAYREVRAARDAFEEKFGAHPADRAILARIEECLAECEAALGER